MGLSQRDKQLHHLPHAHDLLVRLPACLPACCSSLYPVMLAANLEIFFPQLGSGWPRM